MFAEEQITVKQQGEAFSSKTNKIQYWEKGKFGGSFEKIFWNNFSVLSVFKQCLVQN